MTVPMISDRSKHCLLLLLLLLVVANNAESTTESKGVTTTNTTTTRLPAQDKVLTTPSRNVTETTAQAGQVVCKENEILTTEKGCVDSSTVIRTILAPPKCPANNCTSKQEQVPVDKPRRVSVLPSYLHNGKLYKNQGQIPKKKSGTPSPDGELSQADDSESSPKDKGKGKKKDESSQQTVIGHNRKRTYQFLPGRLLKTYRKCRPYEVMGSNNRCIRKKGKVGFYKHKNHVYGSQKRHRHPALNEQEEPNNLSSALPITPNAQ